MVDVSAIRLPELRQWLIQNIGNPEMIEGESVENYRRLLRRLRSKLESKLPNWTWHLEVDNKADRMGWYVRAPESWCSLFTIFVRPRVECPDSCSWFSPV